MSESDAVLERHEPPTYGGLFERELLVPILTGVGLLGLNIVLMVAVALTPLAGVTLWLYGGAPFAPITGLIVFGAALTGGRWLGLSGLTNGNGLLAIVGIVLSQATYGLFGGGILSVFPNDIWVPAIGITTVVTLAITAVCALAVYKTDVNFAFAGTVSFVLLAGGSALIGVGFFFGGGILYMIGFAAFLIGFVADLLYEIWRASVSGRSPLANGFAIYIAAAGVFVHVLQIVLELLSYLDN
jgi:FtsH-binding integral membrane protein